MQPPTDFQRLQLLVLEASRLRQTEGPARSPDIFELEEQIDDLRARIYGPQVAQAARHFEEITAAMRAITPEPLEAA